MKKNQSPTRAVAMDLVLKCGIPPSLKGCKHLAEAIELYATDGYSFTDTYRTIGKRHRIETKSVTRDIAYAIAHGFDVAERLSAIMGFEIPYAQIHNSLVISYLALKLKSITADKTSTDNAQ